MPFRYLLRIIALGLLTGVFPPETRGQGEREPAAELIKRAEKGDAVARVKLGLIRSSTDAQLASEIQAAQWYQQATEQNNIASQHSLGLMFESGPSKDAAESFRWFKMAAERGHPVGQLKVGTYYATCTGTTKNSTEAAFWFRKSAEQENVGAQRNLGLMLLNGTGIAKDVSQAARWLRKAADQADVTSQYTLGVLFNSPATKNATDSAIWFRKAAEVCVLTNK